MGISEWFGLKSKEEKSAAEKFDTPGVNTDNWGEATSAEAQKQRNTVALNEQAQREALRDMSESGQPNVDTTSPEFLQKADQKYQELKAKQEAKELAKSTATQQVETAPTIEAQNTSSGNVLGRIEQSETHVHGGEELPTSDGAEPEQNGR